MARSQLTTFSRRDFSLAVMAVGAGATPIPRWAAAQGLVERLDDLLKRELTDLSEDAREGAAKLLGLETWVYGYPLVIMHVTRAVMTAASKSGEYSAPVDQFTRMLKFVDPDFKNVVRISRNGLWSTAFVDLDREPFIISVPAIKERYYIVQAMNMWTDNFLSVGPRTTGTDAAAELSDAGRALGRLGGIALLGVGLAAWSAPATARPVSSARALLIYNMLATIYLGYLAGAMQLTGILLWPAISVHGIFAVLLAFFGFGREHANDAKGLQVERP